VRRPPRLLPVSHRSVFVLTATVLAAAVAVTGVASPAGATTTPAHAGNHGHGRSFDLQAHRGGIGLTVENTIASFSKALDLGVSTLELDVQITRDGYAVVTHDRDPVEKKCTDTGPAFPNDPQFPYVPGTTYISELTLAQVHTIDCGSLAQPEFPGQQTAPGSRMPMLSEVFALVRQRHASSVKLNVETKVEAGAPEQTAPREQFVQVVAQDVRRAQMLRQVTIQSFDWGSLMRMRQVEPRLPIVALTNGQQFLQVGLPGASPWLVVSILTTSTGRLLRRRPPSAPMPSPRCTATRRTPRSPTPAMWLTQRRPWCTTHTPRV
jgi:glycerophosphoryl diester phosphodiesterase